MKLTFFVGPLRLELWTVADSIVVDSHLAVVVSFVSVDFVDTVAGEPGSAHILASRLDIGADTVVLTDSKGEDIEKRTRALDIPIVDRATMRSAVDNKIVVGTSADKGRTEVAGILARLADHFYM